MYEDESITKDDGLTYYFSARVRPENVKQLDEVELLARGLSGNVVEYTTSYNDKPVTITHHDSILDHETKHHSGWKAIYSIVYHKIEGHPHLG